jgi:putative phosphoesterase
LKSFKIGVLSDTHKRGDLQDIAIDFLKEEGANYLLHLGDFESVKNLENLANSNLPYAAVFGNNDYNLKGLESRFKIDKEPYYLKIKNTTIKMMHLPYYLSGDCDIVLFGHLHKFSVEFKNNTLFLNPGEICAREKNLSECAIIEVFDNRYIVKYYYRVPNSPVWELKEYIFLKEMRV